MSDPLENILAGIKRAKAPNEGERKNDRRMGWLNTPFEADLIDRAAQKRNISRNAFLRRAAVSMACAVLELDYYEVMRGTPVVRTFDTEARQGLGGTVFVQHRNIPGSENGRGAGPWRITGLVED